MMVLSREEERSMSGKMGVVAIWVTQPLWPLREPLKVICSVMMGKFGPVRSEKKGNFKGGFYFLIVRKVYDYKEDDQVSFNSSKNIESTNKF